MSDVIRLAINLREIAEHGGEGQTVIQLECRENDPRAELVILREDILCRRLPCELSDALEMLACAHELFRVRGLGLRVEIVARKTPALC